MSKQKQKEPVPQVTAEKDLESTQEEESVENQDIDVLQSHGIVSISS